MTSIYKRKGRRGFTLEYLDGGRLRQKSFPTKAAAQEFERRVQASAGLAGDRLFSDYARGWQRASNTAIKAGTAKNYAWALDKHILPAFEGFTLREISRERVRELIVRLREGGLEQTTVATVYKVLHACLETAVEDGILATNPARLRRAFGRSAAAAVKALDVDQVRAFFEEAEGEHAVIFRVMVGAGLRPGEALALQSSDLEYSHGRIRIERALTQDGRVEAVKTAKTGEWEYVDMAPGLAEVLRSWERQLAARALASGRPRPPWLFSIDRHAYHRLLAAFRRAAKRAGLPPHFTPHCLRHTFVTQHLINGASVYYVSRQARHKDIRLTVRVYGSWLPAGNPTTAAALEDRLFGPRPDNSLTRGA